MKEHSPPAVCAFLQAAGWTEAEAAALARIEPGDQVVGPHLDQGRGWVVVLANGAPRLKGTTSLVLLYGRDGAEAAGRFASVALRTASAASTAALAPLAPAGGDAWMDFETFDRFMREAPADLPIVIGDKGACLCGGKAGAHDPRCPLRPEAGR